MSGDGGADLAGSSDATARDAAIGPPSIGPGRWHVNGFGQVGGF